LSSASRVLGTPKPIINPIINQIQSVLRLPAS
jgi:hypothetical protein